MTATLIANVVLCAAVFVTIAGLISWSIATQAGDRRHVFVRRARRPQRASARARLSGAGARAQAWPAA